MDSQRRRLLRLLGLSVGGLAGCLGDDETIVVGDETETDTETAAPTEGPTSTPSATSTEEPTETTDGETTTELDSVTFGTCLPMTGSLQTFGDVVQAAVELAVSHVDEAGGVGGRAVELVHADTESSTDRATVAFERVADAGAVGVVGPMASGASARVAERAVARRIVSVSPSASAPPLSKSGYADGGHKYFARTVPSLASSGRAMATALENQTSADSVSVLYVDNETGRVLTAELEASFEGSVETTVPVDGSSDDFGNELDAALEVDPDAVAVLTYYRTGGPLLKGLEDRRYDGELVISQFMKSEGIIDELGSAAEGAYVVAPSPVETDGTDRFEAAMERTIVFAANAYDALFLQALALERAGEVSGTAIAEHLRQVANPPGTAVTVGEFGRARDVLASGGEVNYQGASSRIWMTESLDTIQRYGVWVVRNGNATLIDHVSVEQLRP